MMSISHIIHMTQLFFMNFTLWCLTCYNKPHTGNISCVKWTVFLGWSLYEFL